MSKKQSSSEVVCLDMETLVRRRLFFKKRGSDSGHAIVSIHPPDTVCIQGFGLVTPLDLALDWNMTEDGVTWVPCRK